MRDNMDELLKKTYHNGEKPANALNQAVMQKIKEHDDMKKTNKRVIHFGNMRGMKKLIPVAVAFAAVVLVGSGAVYAATKYFGLEHFFAQYGGKEFDEGVENLIDKQPDVVVKEQKSSRDILDYEVKEVLCDSDYMLATIHVSVKDTNKYFLVSDPYASSVSSLSIGIDSDKSIEEYCKDNGLVPVWVDMPFDAQTEKAAQKVVQDSHGLNTGQLTVMIGAERLTDDGDFMVNVKPVVYFLTGKDSTYEDDILQIHVKDSSKAQSADYVLAKNQKNISVAIEKVSLKSTEVGTYLTVTYTGLSEVEDATGMLIDLCDKKGNAIPINITWGNCRLNKNGSYTYKGCYENIDLPDEIYLLVGDEKQIVKCEKK